MVSNCFQLALSVALMSPHFEISFGWGHAGIIFKINKSLKLTLSFLVWGQFLFVTLDLIQVASTCSFALHSRAGHEHSNFQRIYNVVTKM